MPSTNNSQSTTVPDPWYIQLASYKDGVKGAAYSHASGVELKTFMGWTKTVILGVKSEIVLGGSVSTLLGGAIKTTVCADWNIQKGLKKDTSWGNKREWRKGDISLRCIGKKEDFVFSEAELISFSPEGSFSAAKVEKTNLDKLKSTALARDTQYNTIKEAKKQIWREFSTKQTEINAPKFSVKATKYVHINASDINMGSAKSFKMNGGTMSLEATSIKIKGKINLGGVAIPDFATAAQLAKLEANLAAQELAITALKAKGQAMRARSLSLALPI